MKQRSKEAQISNKKFESHFALEWSNASGSSQQHFVVVFWGLGWLGFCWIDDVVKEFVVLGSFLHLLHLGFFMCLLKFISYYGVLAF